MNTKSFNTYLSKTIYDNLVPKDHFLKKLNEILDWNELLFDLHLLSKNEHGGRPRYNPVCLFKMLFLSFLYDLSDRGASDFCRDNIPAKFFIGLDITEPAPDFTTLSVFRKEILNQFGEEWISSLIKDLALEAQRQGIKFSSIHALDATHTIACVDTHKDKERQDQGQGKRDPDAKWGAKGTEIKITPNGEKVKVVKFFYGYKAHLLCETSNGLIVANDASSGNEADINAGEKLLIKQLNERERKDIKTIAADKAYGDGVLIGILEKDYGVKTAFALNGQFFKGKYKEHWKAYRDDPERVEARKKRYVIERINADLKNNHGLKRCRYLGLTKYHFQVAMASIAHNLKIITTLLTGARLRPV